jgi:microtubule-associated protein-like 1/2
VSVSNDQKLLAVGDNQGKVKIYTYPAHLTKQNFISLEGHANNVLSVVFMPDDSYLVTTGELDCSVMVWAYKN